ncbi:hypothetical protein ACFVTE_18680 [Arthrobacter sp. NPDC058097]|uniref:hypothetical protein n=1 Tax=Arthrobacter sp. NPDC058097 TaxID=3346340 RepID=UPI0036DA5303
MPRRDQEQHENLRERPGPTANPEGNTGPATDKIDAWAAAIIGLLALFVLIYALAAYLGR